MFNHLEQKANIASLIDHTLLKPQATESEIIGLCAEARQWGFASVCVNPFWVRVAGKELVGTPVRVCTVIGFPLGENEPQTKIAEAKIALEQGATELDVVQNIGALRSGDVQRVYQEIADLSSIVHTSGAILKVILETCLLTDEEKERACRIAVDAQADFVKTSTGFAAAGATVEDVSLMRRTVGEKHGVKASGGIRNLETLQSMVKAGANRIGTSSGVTILQELSYSFASNVRENSGGY